MDKKFEKYCFKKRLASMVSLDFKRLFMSKFFYIIIGSCLLAPILILIMTKMMEGSPMNDQYGNPILDEFGNPVLMEGFKNVWQMLGTVSGANTGMSMDITSMCNINMLYFAITVFVSLFIGQEFKSGYSKNLFTMRSSKKEYIFSKSIVSSFAGMLMVLAFFLGIMIGGAVSGVSFELVDVNIMNIIMCLLAKLGLVLVFVGIFVIMSVLGKDKIWLSMITGFAVSMLLFMMIPIISPLNSTIVEVLMSFVGGLLFIFGLGLVSTKILEKTNLV